MRKLPCIVLLQVILLFALASGADPCAPECTTPNTNVIDPHDCTQYYHCYADLTPSSTPERCPLGENFEPTVHSCGPYPCHKVCGNCHLACDVSISFDVVADASDCSLFYECDGDVVGTAHSCSGMTPYFDSQKKQCGDNITACCNPGCYPHCEANRNTVPDPTDCTKYYTCINGYPANLNSCPAGTNFEIGSGECKAGATCNQWCDPVEPGGCLTSMTCNEEGYFPKCPDDCDPRYFFCSGPGLQGIEEECTGGLVFNPVPGYPYCLREEDCPYAPLK